MSRVFFFRLNRVTTLRKRVIAGAICLLFPVLVTGPLEARDEAGVELPEIRHLAASLSDPESRTDTLLTLLSLAQIMQTGAAPLPANAASVAERFEDDRSWLDQLAGRFASFPVRGGHLDPAAWFILGELDQHGLPVSAEVSPAGPRLEPLLRQLFDRSDVRLAAAVLPEALQLIEFKSVELWAQLLRRLPSEEGLLALMPLINERWFEPAPVSSQDAIAEIEQAAGRLQVLMANALLPHPPDPLRLKRLRFDLYSALPELTTDEAREAAYLLTLALAVDGLQDRRYLSFAESLLWIVSDLLLRADALSSETVAEAVPGAIPGAIPGAVDAASVGGDEPLKSPQSGLVDLETPAPGELSAPVVAANEAASVLPALLAEWLPAFSSAYAREFAEVDPRINTALAAAFDAAQYLRDSGSDSNRIATLRREIADAVSQLVMLLPDMDFYFDQPVRLGISEEIDICTSIIAATRGRDTPALARPQFDGCLESMADMAATVARREELAGGPRGPFGIDQLRRELLLTPAQRINYLIGLLHNEYPGSCAPPDQPLPNPVEWASLATLFTWFARQSPVYFQTPLGESQLKRIRDQGRELQSVMARQLDCISGSGTGINDPVVRGLADYRAALDALTAGIREAEIEFRSAALKDGADVVLEGDAMQATAYRSEGLKIGPCDPERICGMSGELEATRALIGLFPHPYLIADQTGLGGIEICYDNMKWVDRRAEPVRADDAHVANYFGRLSFDLVGRYREQGQVTEVFGSRFVSPDEYHYLFAAATGEVLEDNCPTEWEGQKIVTTMRERSFRVVPDRLTYLAAARQKPSAIIEANWSRGAEWRDWFVTRLGVEAFEFDADSTIVDRVNRHLRALYQAEQAAVYGALLQPPLGGATAGQESLFEQVAGITTRKALVRAQLTLFYPDLMLHSDVIRGLFEGQDALLDREVLRRFRELNVAVESVRALGLARLEKLRTEWIRQPDAMRRSGSAEISVAHALVRLNALHAEFFGTADPVGAAPAAISY